MDPASRLLRLLSLLQARPQWSGCDLAVRLGVTERTVRRDVTRLRDLGYPVDGAAGIDGGYRLGAGGRLPPLLLDDDEAVAIALGLRLAATASLAGMEQSAVAALAKIDQVLPTRLGERVRALTEGLVQMRGAEQPEVDAEVLLIAAIGCRRSEGLRFLYSARDGHETERSVEPLQVVHTGRRWYLVGRDRDRQAWRTFRVDRMREPALTGHRYTFDDPPNAEMLVSEATMVSTWSHEAHLVVHGPVDEVRRRYPATTAVVEPDPEGDPDKAVVRTGANGMGSLVSFVLAMPFDVQVVEPPELRQAVKARIEYLMRHGFK